MYKEQIEFSQDDFVGGNINSYAIFKAFTHMATKHAELLGVGFADMVAKKLLWVTMRVKYQILGKILPNHTYIIKTFPQAKNLLEFDRDFLLQDGLGNVLIKGTSKWCVIDSSTRRIARMQNVDVPCAEHEPVFADKFLKTAVFVPQTAPDYSYKVVNSDIDYNGHMNNSVYAKIVFDALMLNDQQIETFQLNFLREAMLGDRLDIYLQQKPEGIYVIGKRCEAENSFSAFIKLKN